MGPSLVFKTAALQSVVRTVGAFLRRKQDRFDHLRDFFL